MGTSYVDLRFGVNGDRVAQDHSYALYGALSRLIPTVHGAKWLAVQPLSGPIAREDGPDSAAGNLWLRVPADRIGELIPLVGAKLDIAGCTIVVGAPVVSPLKPAAELDAKLVVIRFTGGVAKPFDREVFEQRFIAEAQRQLVALGVRGDLALRGRRSLRVKGQRILGYAVRIVGLSTDDSIALQAHGIGGKRTMGCGIFRPAIAVASKQRAA